jgi:6-phosphofructokinase 1
MKAKTYVIVQSGGPTAVINASLYGFLAQCFESGSRVLGAVNGINGLVEGKFIDLTKWREIDRLPRIPGAALGSGRRPLREHEIDLIVDRLRERRVHGIALIGGNGTMWTCNRIARRSEQLGLKLQVIGIPKTVDNDVMETDHTPGFGSAARFVAHAVRDLSVDLQAMIGFEGIRIIETMGRNSGWLAASAMLAVPSSGNTPYRAYIPELAFELDAMLQDAAQVYEQFKYGVFVVSEGIRDRSGQPLATTALHNGSGTRVLGGVGGLLAGEVIARLGIPCRYENLGMLQRCMAALVSEQDRSEAIAVGRRAAAELLAGRTGRMICIRREEGAAYTISLDTVELERTAGVERKLDERFLTKRNGLPVNQAYLEWLRPLAGTVDRYPNFELEEITG